MEELIGEVLGLVDDEDGDLAEVVDEMDDSALEVGDELTAAMRGAQAEGGRERAVDVERGDAGVAEVDDLVLGPGERVAQVAERGGLPAPDSPVRTAMPGSAVSQPKTRARRRYCSPPS